jgi:hypothetical protein
MSNQSALDNFGKLMLQVPGLSDPVRWRDLIFNEIPLLQFVPLEKMDKVTLTRVASGLYLLGVKHGMQWLMKLPFTLNSKTVVDLFRDYVSPERLSIFYNEYVGWYPAFEGLSERGILAHLSKIEEAVKAQRTLGNSGYLPHNERMIVFYYVTHWTEEHPVVTVDPESEHYEYITGRLKRRGVFHLTDEVNGKLYTVMTHYMGRVLTISGRVRSLPAR